MAQPLPLTAQRRHEREVYNGLTARWQEAGIGALVMWEIRELENLHQKFLNGEFEEKVAEDVLAGLARGRQERVQGRAAKDEEPFDKTCLSRWRWNKEGKRYEWIPSDGNQPEPIDYKGGPFFWQPEGILPPGLGPEGTPQLSR